MKELHEQGIDSLKEQDLTMIIFDGKRDRTKVMFEDEDVYEFLGVKEIEHDIEQNVLINFDYYDTKEDKKHSPSN